MSALLDGVLSSRRLGSLNNANTDCRHGRTALPTHAFHPPLFTHQKLSLHALLLERQAWFCLRDLGRLMGKHLDERATRKLAPAEHRRVPLNYYGEARDTLMVNESAAYALLVFNHHPANQHLRQWLSGTVLPLLREAHSPTPDNLPAPGVLEWQGGALNVLHWQSEPWIRLRDMPSLLPGRDDVGARQRIKGWWNALWNRS